MESLIKRCINIYSSISIFMFKWGFGILCQCKVPGSYELPLMEMYSNLQRHKSMRACFYSNTKLFWDMQFVSDWGRVICAVAWGGVKLTGLRVICAVAWGGVKLTRQPRGLILICRKQSQVKTVVLKWVIANGWNPEQWRSWTPRLL
jgi:hypothetical protein